MKKKQTATSVVAMAAALKATDTHEHTRRIESLDALRGFDMLLISGLGMVLSGFCRLFPDGAESWVAQQFRHVKWEGLAFWDTIFPLFIFLTGVSYPFSFARQCARGESSLAIHARILKRMFVLVLLGMIYNGLLQFDFSDFRYASVLGKIGVAWAVAALAYVHFGVRVRIGICVALLVGYWALLTVSAPDAPAGFGSWTAEGCFPGYLDRIGFTPGHLYEKNVLEPSGLPVSVMGSSVTAILGMFAGDILRKGETVSVRKSVMLVAIGICLTLAGLGLSVGCPVIKKLWTPSFTLLTGGYSFLMLALFHWIIDVRGCTRWCFFLRVVGVNSVAVYMFKRIVDCTAISQFFLGGVAKWFPDPHFAIGLGVLALCWGFCWFLDRHRLYLKV